MKSTGQKLIIFSFLLALIASGIVFWYLQSLKAPKTTVKKATVLVAAETIPPRTLIDKEMIKEITVTDSALFSDCLKSSSDIAGKYTKETIMKNEGFNKEKLLDKDSNDLSLILDNDYRALSINVTGASAVSGLLKPGDFVDIVVFLAEKKDQEKAARPDIEKMILQNVKVLAVDKNLNRDEKTETSQDKGKDNAAFLVTLSVKTSDVEKLSLAENTGNIKLALRPVNDDKTINTNGETSEQLLIDTSESNVPSLNQSGSTNDNDSKYTSYTVKHGDTLKKISRNFYGDESKYTIIRDANDIKNQNLIIPGEVLRIPKLE